MKKVTINSIKQGEYFKFKETETSPVWIRGYYERTSRKYECYKYDDVNHERFINGNTEVFIDFEF